MLRRLLYLEGDELKRLWPFFALYLVMFGSLTIADGVSLSLFVQRVGSASLPKYYALTAAANLLLIGGYLMVAEKQGSRRVFHAILGMSALAYLGAFAAITTREGGGAWYGMIFVVREISYALILMHFGTYLQEYFTRDELNRVLPIVYAGGRVGGILGGAVLEHLGGAVGLANFVLVAAMLSALAMLGIAGIGAIRSPVSATSDEKGDPGVRAPKGIDADAAEIEARRSIGGFLRYVLISPLLFWTTVSSVIYTACRWLLNYQYNAYFETHFATDVEMAAFLGRYTQIALAGSLLFQLVIVNRLVARFGIRGTQMIYACLVALGFGLNLASMTFGRAVFSRVLETELRFGLRNPVMQLITNKFSKAMRIRVRAWSLGALIPIATLGTSAVLGVMTTGLAGWVAWVGAASGAGYLASSWKLTSSFRERLQPKDAGEMQPGLKAQ